MPHRPLGVTGRVVDEGVDELDELVVLWPTTMLVLDVLVVLAVRLELVIGDEEVLVLELDIIAVAELELDIAAIAELELDKPTISELELITPAADDDTPEYSGGITCTTTAESTPSFAVDAENDALK